MANGTRSVAEIQSAFAHLGASADSLDLLLRQGFIRLLPESNSDLIPGEACVQESSVAPGSPEVNLSEQNSSAQAQFYTQLYQHMASAVKTNLGLKGFLLLLKVEKAGSVQELLELNDAIADALAKSRGLALANAFVSKTQALVDQHEDEASSALA
jgi:hypothetical protein